MNKLYVKPRAELVVIQPYLLLGTSTTGMPTVSVDETTVTYDGSGGVFDEKEVVASRKDRLWDENDE